MPWEAADNQVDTVALETHLKERLRGRRLVCEAGLDPHLHGQLSASMRELRARGVTDDLQRLRGTYPATTVCFLAAEGVYNYVQGDFWPNLSVQDLPRDNLSKAFERAIRSLGLETFERLAEEGQRFVTPILAHGGIPRYCLRDYFKLLTAELRHGAVDGEEVLAHWRRSRHQFTGVDRPVARFLLHGGPIVVDLLNRTIDMIHSGDPLDTLSAAGVGLPEYIVDAYRQLPASERYTPRVALQRASVPSPIVTIDPWTGSGPVLWIPGSGKGVPPGAWTLVSPEGPLRFRAKSTPQEVPLHRDKEWIVTFASTEDGVKKTFAFPGMGDTGLLFFGYDTRRLVDPDRPQPPLLWLLYPGEPDQVRTGDVVLPAIEKAPALSGDWTGFVLAAYELPESARVHLGEPSKGISLRIRNQTIRLAGPGPVRGVSVDESGLPVYAGVPALEVPDDALRSGRTRITVEWNGTSQQFSSEEAARHGSGLLAHMIPRDAPGIANVIVRGSLGEDFRATFAIVPGLAVEGPNRLLVPGSPPSAVRVTAYGWDINQTIPPAARAVDVPVQVDDLVVFTLSVEVPTLLWVVWLDGKSLGSFDQSTVPLDAADLLDGKPMRLLIRTTLPELPVALELRAPDGKTIQALYGTTGGPEGRWAFDLAVLTSSVRESAEARLSLNLVAGSYDVPVATLYSEPAATEFRVESAVDEETSTLAVRFVEARQLTSRLARLWPLSEPWNAPIEESIPDGQGGAVRFQRPVADLPPGDYLLQITTAREWTAVRRPKRRSPSTETVRIGAPDAIWRRSRVDYAGSALGLLVDPSHLRDIENIDPALVRECAKEAWLALAIAVEYDDWADAKSRQWAFARLLAAAPLTAGISLVEAVTQSAIQGGEVLPVALPVVGAILARAREGGLHSAHWSRPSAAKDSEVMVALWSLCPPLALATSFVEGLATPEQLREFLGIHEDLDTLPFFPHERELMWYLQRTKESLEGVARTASLVPRGVLDPDSLAASQLEWLIADGESGFSTQHWGERHGRLADRLPVLPDAIFQRFEAGKPKNLLAAFGRRIAFPTTVFAAALHSVTDSGVASHALTALQEAAGPCPRIVARSVVHATVSVLPYLLREDDDAGH